MNYLLLDMATVMVDFDMKSSFHSSSLSNFDWLSEQGGTQLRENVRDEYSTY